MPCELGVASLSAPRPASLGLLSVLALGILAAGLRRVLAADRAAFGIPLAVPPPLARLGGGISWVLAPARPPSPRGCSASRQRFPRAAAGANVVTSPGAAGVGQENPLASHPAGDLQAPVLAMLAESPLYVGAVQRRYSRRDFRCIHAVLWRNPSCFASMSGRRCRCRRRGLQESRKPRPLLLRRGSGWS
jgi:hypothetical protein